MKDVCIYDYDDQCCHECPGCPKAVSDEYEPEYYADDYHEQETQ